MRCLINLLLLLGCLSPALVWAQKPKRDATEVLKQLLAMPAPQPGETNEPEESEPEKRPDKFFDKNNAPPDNAPLGELQEYWSHWAREPERPEPSDAVKQRLFDATAGDYEWLTRYLPVLEGSEPITIKVKAIYDKIADDKQYESQSYRMKEWLLHNSNYFRGELLERANTLEESWSGRSAQKLAVNALAKLDWETAEPLLKSFSTSSEQRLATTAISLLYQHAIKNKNLSDEQKFRERLQSIAADLNQPGFARNDAIEVLSTTEWSGRDDWYLALFDDESLIELRDGVYSFTPLDVLFAADPDKWIPIAAKMVGNNKGVQLQSAAGCLVRYGNLSPRRDALLPLVRWLSDPDWLRIDFYHRATLRNLMEQVDIPESVPGLIWIIENERADAPWAAASLARYKDPRSIPAIKGALADTHEQHRGLLVDALLEIGGLSETEALDALELYAEKLLTPEGKAQVNQVEFQERLPVQLSIGRHLAIKDEPPAWLVQAVLARVASLRKRNAPLAQSLVGVAHRWKGRQIDADIIQRIASGTADADSIAVALSRRRRLRESAKTELQALLQAPGIAPAVGAVLLDDSILARTIISSGDQTLQIALLAAARLTLTPLPVNLVGAFLKSKNALLAHAAERYLLAEDSKEARALLWQHHPGEAFITGWRENIWFFDERPVEVEKIEADLRAELFKENGPLEIFALFADAGDMRVLRIYRDRATYTHHDDTARYAERTVSKAELASFKDHLATNNVRDLGPQSNYCHHACQIAEFLMITKDEGRRVVSREEGGWELVSGALDKLGENSVTRIRYKFEEQIKGVQVLYADKDPEVLGVSLQGDEIRVHVERAETEADINEKLLANDDVKEEELNRARFTWRKLAGNKLGDVTTPPDDYPSGSENKVAVDLEALSREHDLDPSQGKTRSASGEFAPLFQMFQNSRRFLQATGKVDEVWAAIPDGPKGQTKVGRYNLKTYSFTPVTTIPQIWFDSMMMWVDEKRERVLLVYRSQLLSIPLKPQP